jgi:hypothetical protein
MYMETSAGDCKERGNPVIISAWRRIGNTFESRLFGPAGTAPVAAERAREFIQHMLFTRS